MHESQMFSTYWQEIVDWFVIQPLYGQILILIGVIALLALAVVIVYYVLKGVAYLVFYILKGTYYLLKGIGLLFFKLFEGLYYAISGRPKPGSQVQQNQIPTNVQIVQKTPSRQTYQEVLPEAIFCSECGNKFSDSMLHTLSEKNVGYCIHCGKGFQANSIGIEN